MTFPKIDLNLLPCFQVVASTGSISKASQELHLTQPAISLQIKKLETELGAQLFDRHNRGLILTPLGSKLLHHIKKMMQTVSEIEDLTNDSHQIPSGTINVGTYTTASSYLLPPILKTFFADFPKVSINYNYEPTENILEMIKSYKLDCAILSEVPDDPKLEITHFFKDELIFVTSSQNLKRPKRITPKELKDFSFLSYPLRYDYCYQMVEKNFGSHLKKAHIPIETTSFDTLKQTLLHGTGASFIPAYIIQEELMAKKLTRIEIGNKKLPIIFSFVTKKDASLSKATLELKKVILQSRL